MNLVARLYGAGTAFRNALFDRDLLRARRLNKPVVSVGNLSAGGTGKTPFVIMLGDLLRERSISFDVLSRGYRRRSRGVLVVNPSGSAKEFGDEPLLIAQRLGAPVIVGESRYQAGLVAEKEFQSQVHLLDDGFQHRSLVRDYDIVLVAAGDLQDRLLPSGSLREPLSSLQRADAIVVAPEIAPDSRLLQGRSIWLMRREILLRDIPRRPIVFCAIARPEPFFAQVRAAEVSPAAEISFRDHHAYKQDDVARLNALRRDNNAGGFVTTEKDVINLGRLRSELEPLCVAQLQLSLDRPADLVDTIVTRITDQRPRS